MKALTLTQPWASLYLTPRKRIETRSWPTRHRGSLAIHAAKGWTLADRKLAFMAGYATDELPRAAVIGCIYLQDCLPITDNFTVGMPVEEITWGNYAPGRYAWQRREFVFTFEPVPAKGALGLWEWDWPSNFPHAAYTQWLSEVRQ